VHDEQHLAALAREINQYSTDMAWANKGEMGVQADLAGCAAAALPSFWTASSTIRRCPSSRPMSLRS
jgi:hypothetical protein